MAVIDNTSLTGPTSDTGRTAGFFATLFARLAAWNDARVTRRALNALSDRELSDIGLERADIDSVVSKG